jgi:kynurenine 3-monooxygenase
MSALGSNGAVVVVGGGPCGSLLAINLAQAGHEVTVFESRPDMRRVDISAGRSINLALANRGFAALATAGEGVTERVEAITIPMRGRMVHIDGKQSLQPYGNKPTDVIHSVARGDLNAILLDAAVATGRVTIRFEQRCRRVDFSQRKATFTDERSGDSYDVPFGTVFGTDGASSAVRDALIAAADTVVTSEPLGHGYKELQIPALPGGKFQLDPNGLHIWPRGQFMLIALANPAGDFTATIFMPMTGPDSFETLRTSARVAPFFSREFPDFVPLVPDLVKQFAEHPTGSLSTIRTSGWGHGARGLLLGDAAHAIVPFHGQGMNAAMESCRVLMRHIAVHPDDLAAAFRSFEFERKVDVDAIADMAIENYVEMRSGVTDPHYLIKRELALELETRFPDRISPRYNMVMFSDMPFSEAKRRAEVQNALLEELVTGRAKVADVDYAHAAELVVRLEPLPQ